MKKHEIIEKQIGETPLEALERFRSTRPELKDEPMTYAGRLDPMAEGKLLILWGEECKNKEKYLNLDKEYEVEIVFGIKTDSYDALGLAEIRNPIPSNNIDLNKLVGRFTQEYPACSSKTLKGKQLHELARSGDLPDEMPTKEVEIYSIELLNKSSISAADLKERIFGMIDKVKGDFRQEQIRERWEGLLCHSRESGNLCHTTKAMDPRVKPACLAGMAGRPEDDTRGDLIFQTMKIRVRCSSGTYMRSLADRVVGFALRINRTRIY